MNIFGAASSVDGFIRIWMQEPIPQLSVQQDPLIFLSKMIKVKSGTFWKTGKTTKEDEVMT